MEQKKQERKVWDLPQRTLTGNVVHIIWRIISTLLVIALTIGLIGGVAAKLLYDQAVTYIEEDIKPKANYSLEGQKLNQSSFIYALNHETGEY